MVTVVFPHYIGNLDDDKSMQQDDNDGDDGDDGDDDDGDRSLLR